ncbi:MAG: F0F1 ATP synthase subunit epsilon [Chloroflexota bacterium]|nr:F0F1 ATP synthase subunit epsilon [Chloroflexota bacterium]MDE2959337.1 F0F1 ATP synthase subunit epsilon [Chloroflexota bacterium]
MPMQLQIITAEREVFSGEVDALVAPGVAGQLGILPNHAPLMTVLQPGEMLVRAGGDESYLALSGGYLEVLGNQVIVLADAAEDVDEIDEARAQEALARAQERIASRESDIELEQAVASLRRAQVRVTVARRRRSTPHRSLARQTQQ